MPAASERQRRFMGAELGRLRRGDSTETGMSERQLRDFARKARTTRRKGVKRMTHRKHKRVSKKRK